MPENSRIFAQNNMGLVENPINETYYPLVSKRMLDPFAEHLGVLLFSMQDEIWKDVEGYDRRYQISSFGRVREIKKDGTIKNLKTSMFGTGYVHLNLILDGKQKSIQVHRLVAKAFIPNPNNYPCVNHKDENKSNNHAYNLEWCTHSYNINYGTRIERYFKTCKENHSLEKARKTNIERGRLCAEIAVVALDDNGNVVGEYKSAVEAGKVVGTWKENIRGTIRKNRRLGAKYKCAGFLWMDKSDYLKLKSNK